VNIHISWLAVFVVGGGVLGIIIGGFSGILSIADDHFIRIPFTRDHSYGRNGEIPKTVEVPEWLLILCVPLFYLGILAIIVGLGIQIAVWAHAS
jgi:hypothetical protein